jgi:hypothetical protein
MHSSRPSRSTPSLWIVTVASLVCACGNGNVSSTDQAKQAYLGLDASIDKAIQAGFDGFNSATSANIAPQTKSGAVTGTLTVTGQVDQGASTNKGMRLSEALTTYSDDGMLTYDTTASALPALTMQLKGIGTSNGTLTGTLIGNVTMSGNLMGPVALNVTFTATITGSQPQVSRVSGTTHITGTATAAGATYQIDVTR